MLIVRSPVRISFAGGGTDLPSYMKDSAVQSLSAAINKHFYTVLEKRGDGQSSIISADLRNPSKPGKTCAHGHSWQCSGNSPRGSKRVWVRCLGEPFLASEIPPGNGAWLLRERLRQSDQDASSL